MLEWIFGGLGMMASAWYQGKLATDERAGLRPAYSVIPAACAEHGRSMGGGSPKQQGLLSKQSLLF